MFILLFGVNIIYFLIYVDDILIIGHNSVIVQRYIDLLTQRFSIKDLGLLSYFLGVEVVSKWSGLSLTQKWYNLLARTNMEGAKAVVTPIATDSKSYYFIWCIIV